ncbi:MAG: hypothetical protein EOR30_03700 [Mesorhizobium sp.]|uniref:hypothetical protein n=1 Tax=unclassified Mesorhizobium TaxID=325217 RepID=UPI000FCB8F57|nr:MULTISPECIES: hypothetical protein [unclassified Mesorhizobium]RUV71843.1 hypothetical protein EOA78_16370 [Mesorhizobium sp. M5C.F.Cr.IN.023.01.1.1]RWF82334.1 MAG: hypothetical protein EOQ36_29410 [Mesorhizobium sp.]RWF94749.1 MAG: hypothetical protein EOQ45_11130 [Mesorhizobium sp.]RWI41352.1 MAG: hypothetical protein EOR14_09845 [Mesorhizobium sp.]RWI48580.1 MAG: hypothetical protein EOR16_33235 [Mesorhizobium sp.]
MMADDRTARPVSGEFMTDSAANPAPERILRDPADDVVDAEYEVLPRLTGGMDPSLPLSRVIATPSIEGMDMLRKPKAAMERLRASRGGPIFWIAGLSAAFAAFWISGGHALLRQAPLLLAAQETGAALTISGVTSRIDASGPEPVLFVGGEAANDGASPSPLPPLEIRITGNDRRTTRYRLGTFNRSLAPGERFGFSSRLDVPRNGVKTVSVTFAN